MALNQDKHIEKEKRQLRVRKKERTKQTILTEAEKFFSEKPMNEVSLEDIAEAAFVSRTTLYNYFQNKDEIFFTLGMQAFKKMNEDIKKNFPSDLTGHEQILFFCEHGLRANFERPLNEKIIRESFNRMNHRDASIEEMYYKIAENIGTTKFKKLFENSKEPYLIELYIELQKHRDFWMRAVRKGKIDKTITVDLEDVQIVEFLYILMLGLNEQVELRKSILNRIRVDNETIIRNFLPLVTKFLKNESSSLS
ncbi:MAG: TetR/AcrR family transcriptional regulator [Promethearchaeota archaeon]